jgi:superfamily II DNA/RNA helicase
MSDRNARQTMMFSATFPDEIQSAARQFLNNYAMLSLEIVHGPKKKQNEVLLKQVVPRDGNCLFRSIIFLLTGSYIVI